MASLSELIRMCFFTEIIWYAESEIRKGNYMKYNTNYYIAMLLTITSLALQAEKVPAAYGSWKSPITAELASGSNVGFSSVTITDGTVYWLESRPAEGGRTTIMRWDQQQGEREILSRAYNVNSRVHEYGGGELLVATSGIYFINNDDQQIYRLNADGSTQQITSCTNARFADGSENKTDGSLFYLMEEHDNGNVTNSIVKIDPRTGEIATIASGNDFYSNPRVNPDGTSMAYVTWNHPNMPWDNTELWVVDLTTNTHRMVTGTNEAVTDPQWSNTNELYYVSDRNNWWNIYQENKSEPIWSIEGECTQPQWLFGRSMYGTHEKTMTCSLIQKGANKFYSVDLTGKEVEPIESPYCCVKHLSAENNMVAFIGRSAQQPSSIVLYDTTTKNFQIIKQSSTVKFDPAYITQPEAIEFPTVGNRTAHAFYYPPCNAQFCGLYNELPPLIVMSHGGPTGHSSPGFTLGILYWTSRGFAVIDVNYGGSTGYGREYRERLHGTWGIVDVDDCTYAALYCVEHNLADVNRLAIMGGSAGGFTTLAAMAFRDVFKVGANYFGVSDLERLTLDTHKFESRYLDTIVGPYPEAKSLYIERSPIHSVNTITCPIIIFQGGKDAVVPPSQSEMMYESLRARNIPTAYLLYETEYHGFCEAKNIKRSLEAQLYFFAKVLGFPLSEDIEPVDIKNMIER